MSKLRTSGKTPRAFARRVRVEALRPLGSCLAVIANPDPHILQRFHQRITTIATARQAVAAGAQPFLGSIRGHQKLHGTKIILPAKCASHDRRSTAASRAAAVRAAGINEWFPRGTKVGQACLDRREERGGAGGRQPGAGRSVDPSRRQPETADS